MGLLAALILVGPLLAYYLALILATGARPDPTKCFRCGYSLSGLNNPDLCPECGKPPRAPPQSPPVSRRIYLLFATVAVLTPASMAMMHAPWMLPVLFAWTGVAILLSGVFAIVNGHVSRAQALILASTLLTPALATAVASMLHTWQSGSASRGEPILTIAAPILAATVSFWSFILVSIPVRLFARTLAD